MNPLLLIRLFFSLKSYQQKINEEAKEFDKKNNINADSTTKASKFLAGAKIILMAMVLGELPIDFFHIHDVFAKIDWIGGLSVISFLIFGFMALIAEAEKQEKRERSLRGNNDE